MLLVILAAAALFSLVPAPEEPLPGTISAGPLEGMAFAWIPSGSFMMGYPGSNEMEINQLVHEVTLPAFEMMTTEVTQGMWLAVMGCNPSWHQGDPRLPVERVTWLESQAFAESLDVLDPLHDYRLPSEAEWEYACRAGTDTPFYWGETMDPEYCWYCVPGDTTTIVAGRIPNAWGLYDMSGNVAEWCEDTYHFSYAGAPSDGSAWIDPEVTLRVIRGGSFFPCDIEVNEVYDCRSSESKACTQVSRFQAWGFRLVRTPR